MTVIVGMAVTAAAPAAFGVRMIVAVVMVVRVAVAAAAAALMRVVVPMIGMAVIVAMAVIVTMVMPAAATIAMMVMLVRIGQHGREPALERNRLLARRVARFDGERHHLGTKTQVVHLAEVVPPQASLPVEHEHRRRAADFVIFHRLRQTSPSRRSCRARSGT